MIVRVLFSILIVSCPVVDSICKSARADRGSLEPSSLRDDAAILKDVFTNSLTKMLRAAPLPNLPMLWYTIISLYSNLVDNCNEINFSLS